MNEHNTLAQSLAAAGLNPIYLGDRVLVLPNAGRVIGLYPQAACNVLWTNIMLESPDVLRAALADPAWADPAWANLGGERTWISPELDTHVADPRRFGETYNVPKAVDPAAYTIAEQDDRSLTLVTDMRVEFHRKGIEVDLCLTERVSIIEESPVPVPLPDDVTFAGYQNTRSLATTRLPRNVNPGIWGLVQVPGGGKVFAPVRTGCSPRAFIGSPVLTCEENLVTANADTDASFKFSISARHATGCLAYLRSDGGEATLVVNCFEVADEESYFDVPCDDQYETGHMTQVYIDDGQLGGFAELEHHSPGCDARKNRMDVEDVSEVWAFAGPVEALEEICRSMIGAFSK